MEKANDEELIKLLSAAEKNQHNRGLKLVYSKFYEAFKSFFLKQGADRETIEDIFQDSIIGLYMNVRKPEFNLTSNLSTYLIAIGKNIWYKKLRAKKDTVDLEAVYSIGAEDDYLDLWSRKQEIEKIKKLMEQLGTSCKSILYMFYLDRYSMKEIALRMNYANDQVARNQKSKCMSKLIKLYKATNG